MSDQERIMVELNKLSTADLVQVQELIRGLKRRRRKKANGKDKPYLRVRQALKNVKTNLANEISNERDERI